MPAIRSKVIPENILKRMSSQDRKPLGKSGKLRSEIELKVMRDLEKQLHKECFGILTLRNITAIGHARMDRKSTYTVGWPDFTFSYRGHACAVECKVANEQPSSDQIDMISGMLRDGWRVRVVRTAGELCQFLDELNCS